MSLVDYLAKTNNDLTNHDLAVLADWAGEQKNETPNADWKRAFSLIREGADLLLRRRARSSHGIPMVAANPGHQVPIPVDYLSLRRTINDFESTFYGPHSCECGATVVRRAMEQGGERYEEHDNCSPAWEIHVCQGSKFGVSPANIGVPMR